MCMLPGFSFFFFFLFFHCVSVFCVCSFFISMDLRGLIQIKKEKTERKKIYSLITIQNVVAVCHTVCTHVRGPKKLDTLQTSPTWDKGDPRLHASHVLPYQITKFRRSNVWAGGPRKYGDARAPPSVGTGSSGHGSTGYLDNDFDRVVSGHRSGWQTLQCLTRFLQFLQKLILLCNCKRHCKIAVVLN